MRAPLRPAAALLLLLLLPLLAAAGPAAEETPTLRLEWVLVPDVAAPDAPLAARIRITGPAGAQVEVKAWLEQSQLASHTWNGTAWARSDRYALEAVLDAAGARETWIALRPKELQPGTALLGVRVRAASMPLVTIEHTLRVESWNVVAGLADGAEAVAAARADLLVAIAPVGLERPGAFRLPQVPATQIVRLEPEGVRSSWEARDPGDLRLAGLLVRPRAGPEAEFVEVRNHGPTPVDLAGWALSGSVDVPLRGALDPGASLLLASNATALRAETGLVGAMEAALSLPDAGGEVALTWLDAPQEVVAWGRAAPAAPWEDSALPAPMRGVMFVRTGNGTGADAWSERVAGWTTLTPFRTQAWIAPVLPEHALGTALAAIAEARSELLLEVYTLTSPDLAWALHDALARGVSVRVLVEAAPVGGMSEEEHAVLAALVASGADVRAIGGSGQDRYGTMHAKVAVIDGQRVLLGSENWTPSGFHPSGTGNRGWGAVLHSRALAAHYREVWAADADLARADVRAWQGEASPSPSSSAAPILPLTWERAHVTALLAPDHADDEILALLGRAQSTLDIEALQMPLAWDGGPSPVIEALRAAAARGVAVRALLEGSHPDNARAAEALNAEAQARGWNLEVRLSHAFRVHNKAAIVDGGRVLFGSVNFGEASMTRNREAALIVEGPVGAYQAAFEADWARAGAADLPGHAPVAWLAVPLCALVLLGIARGRRSR